MPNNLALRRAKKAQRRKQALAEKRKVDAANAALPAQVRRAAQFPLECCLMSEALFDAGIGTLILARAGYDVMLASFLIDLQGPGVKNVSFVEVDRDVFRTYTETLGIVSPLVAVDPSYARKLLRDVTAWSRSIGYRPHRDFVDVEALFGDVDADRSDAVFRFGASAAA